MFEDWWKWLHCSAPVFAKVVEELEELIFWSGKQHAIIAQRLNIIFSYLFQSICFHAPSRSQRTLQTCFSTGINPHSSHTNLHRSTSSHLNLSPVWVSHGLGVEQMEGNRSKASIRLPYECPDWFPIDVPVPWTKTWNFITVAVQFMCEPSFGFLGRWPPLL